MAALAVAVAAPVERTALESATLERMALLAFLGRTTLTTLAPLLGLPAFALALALAAVVAAVVGRKAWPLAVPVVVP